jgi:hypothetical protein
MASVTQQLRGLDAETAGAVQDALAPGALVDDTISGAGIGQVDQTRDRQLHEHDRDLPRVWGQARLGEHHRPVTTGWHAACARDQPR